MIPPLPQGLFSRRLAPPAVAPAPSAQRAMSSFPPQGSGLAIAPPVPDSRQVSTAFLGWFESSRELREGLHVIEHAGPPGGSGHGVR